jgi:hypothetical protein
MRKLGSFATNALKIAPLDAAGSNLALKRWLRSIVQLGSFRKKTPRPDLIASALAAFEGAHCPPPFSDELNAADSTLRE